MRRFGNYAVVWLAVVLACSETAGNGAAAGSVSFSERCSGDEDCRDGLFCAAGGALAGLCTLACDASSAALCTSRFGDDAFCHPDNVCARDCSQGCPGGLSCDGTSCVMLDQGQAWVAGAAAVTDWDCFNVRAEGGGATDSCTCTPGLSPDTGDRAPFCFADHPCCILERRAGPGGETYSCQCRVWFLVTDEPSQTDAACDADATGADRLRVDECPPGGG